MNSPKTYDASSKKTGNARVTFPFKIMNIMEEDPNVWFVFSDAARPDNSTGMILARFPDRCIDVGIAEQNMIGTSAGLALAGKKVFCMAFGPFLSLRATDMIHTDLAYNKLPVCVIGTHGGLTSGGGPTHYTLLDSSIMASIPGMTMEVPADANQGLRAIDAFLEMDSPMYIRLARGQEPLVYEDDDYVFEVGKGIIVHEGHDVAIIADGIGVYNGLRACELLEKDGISARLVDMHTVKPIDTDLICDTARRCKAIVTVEDHGIRGGLGSITAEVLMEAGIPCRFKRLGAPSDSFASLGYPEDLYRYYGFDAEGIAATAKNLIEK
ncbi:MAG: transketolase [Oscillospiraceae bacterium]|nr:transketolase [Oscillospiraceae bacterium]